jgi:hypothetical protein
MKILKLNIFFKTISTQGTLDTLGTMDTLTINYINITNY